MHDEDKGRGKAKDAFTFGINILSVVLGGVLTLFLAPGLFDATIGFTENYARDRFGSGWVPLVAFLWGAFCAAGTFAAAMILVSGTVRLGFLKLADLIFDK